MGYDYTIKEYDMKDRSNKECCCGGHNIKNVSRNLNHNSTKQKLSTRKNRRFANANKNGDLCRGISIVVAK